MCLLKVIPISILSLLLEAAQCTDIPTLQPTYTVANPPQASSVTLAPTVTQNEANRTVEFRIKAIAIMFSVVGVLFCGILIHFIYQNMGEEKDGEESDMLLGTSGYRTEKSDRGAQWEEHWLEQEGGRIVKPSLVRERDFSMQWQDPLQTTANSTDRIVFADAMRWKTRQQDETTNTDTELNVIKKADSTHKSVTHKRVMVKTIPKHLSTVAPQPTFKEGMKVNARYRGKSKAFPAVITRDRGDGTFDVKYDDGDTETRVNAGMLSVQDTTPNHVAPTPYVVEHSTLKEGMKVNARYRGKSKAFPAVITRDRGDGTFDVKYDDGDTETRVNAGMLFVQDTTPNHKAPTPYVVEHSTLKEGTKVNARYRGKSKAFPAVITRDRGDGTFDVKYDDGDTETRVNAGMLSVQDTTPNHKAPTPYVVEHSTLKEGTKVNARYRGKSKAFPAVITRDRGDGTFDVKYDDGDTETRVNAGMLSVQDTTPNHVAPTPYVVEHSTLKEGMKVNARYRGKSKAFPAVITRDRGDGTFDIKYDDGDTETRVNAGMLSVQDTTPNHKAPTPYVVEHSTLKEGTKVNARYRGKSKAFPAVITRDRGDGTFDVKYDDGDTETRVNAGMLSVQDTTPNHKAPTPYVVEHSTLKEGTKVNARYRGKSKAFPAVITRDRGDGTFDVKYDDGDTETRVNAGMLSVQDTTPNHVAPTPYVVEHSTLKEGMKVNARYRGKSKAFPAVITRDRGDGTFDVKYDDGDTETRVNAGMLFVQDTTPNHKAPTPYVVEHSTLKEGTKVNARYRGKSKAFPAVITRDRGDGTFDVKYDDGDTETRVNAGMLSVQDTTPNHVST